MPGVERVGELKARVFGPGIYVECKVSVDGGLTVAEGPRIGKRVKAAIMRAVPGCRTSWCTWTRIPVWRKTGSTG